MDFSHLDLDGWLAHVSQQLARATVDTHHPWRWPSLATASPDEGPTARTVVLRSASLSRLSCHTDPRSLKAAQLSTQERAAWCFLHRRHKVQLRMWGPTRLHTDDDVADAAWERLSATAREQYGGPAPGAPAPDGPVPRGRREDFAVLVTDPRQLDLLWLARGGHVRAHYTRSPGETWQGEWVVP